MAFLDEFRGFRSAGAGAAVTIGVFDGVHRGHQTLIGMLAALAAEQGLTTCAVTFLNHPRTVLAHGLTHSYLMTPARRVELLRSSGAACVIPLTFTSQLSQLTYREFVDVLLKKLRLRALLIGADFAMGKGRQGTGATLTELGRDAGFTVDIAEPLRLDGEIVSTTGVRQRVEAGDVERAEALLGRPYALEGVIVHGEARGRELGFPTANLQVPPDILVPADGIYATKAIIQNVTGQPTTHDAVTSIGVRPTFGNGRRTIETYILDFDRDLYGEAMTLQIAQRIREERKFPDISGLVAQIRTDVDEARRILEERERRTAGMGEHPLKGV